MARGCCAREDGAPGFSCCRVEWAMWGNMNALYAAAILFIGGIVGATVETIELDNDAPHNFGAVTRWIVIPISLFIFLVEYPRSARKNRGRNVERPGQNYIAPLLHNTYFIGRNYVVRFLVYMLLLVPALFVLSTILGAMCLFIACVCYFVAALNGEEWKAPSLAWGPGKMVVEEATPGRTLPEAPSHPPPRPPPQTQETSLSAPPTAPPPRPAHKHDD